MTATVAASAAPAWAVKVWADDVNVYAELPSQNGPCVVAYARSEGGLSRCLATLGAFHSAEGHGEPYPRPPSMSKKLLSEGLRPQDLESARLALKQLGIIK